MSLIKNRDEFGKLLKILGLKGYGLEIGVELGNFSKIILDTSDLNKLYLLDPWKKFSKEESQGIVDQSQEQQDKNYNHVVHEMSKYGDRAVIVRECSMNVVNKFEDDFFDFIYIDANHDYNHIKEDLHGWYPKIKKHGVFAGHDYLDGWRGGVLYGVKRAVNEFCSEIKVQPLNTFERHRFISWYFIKP